MVLIPSERNVLADKKGRVDFSSGFFTEYRTFAPFWHLPRGGFLHERAAPKLRSEGSLGKVVHLATVIERIQHTNR